MQPNLHDFSSSQVSITPSRLIEASDPVDVISVLLSLSPVQTQALRKAWAVSPQLQPALGTQGRARRSRVQDQLEEVEAAMVSPVCTVKGFQGLEMEAGWAAVPGQ